MAERAEGSTRVWATPRELMAVIGDFPAYPQWAKAVRRAEVLRRDRQGRATRVAFQIATPLGDADYTLDYTYQPDDQGLSWTYVAGSFRDLRGAYELAPAADGGTTVGYRLEFDLELPSVPGSGLVKRQIARQVVRTALDELKRRVEEA